MRKFYDPSTGDKKFINEFCFDSSAQEKRSIFEFCKEARKALKLRGFRLVDVEVVTGYLRVDFEPLAESNVGLDLVRVRRRDGGVYV
jgi:hypothetical protein